MFKKLESLLREILEIGHLACDLAELEAKLERLHCGGRHQGSPHLAFEFSAGEFTIRGTHMTFTMPPLNAAGLPSIVTVIGSPVKADGSPSKAALASPVYTSSDSTIFTVASDPNVPNGAIITAVANPAEGTTASATLTETATATEPDGTTTEVVTGTATIILSVPPAAPAAALTFTFGTPV
jgi:hypothetical protein